MNTDEYIKIKVIGLGNGDKWVFKPNPEQQGGLVSTYEEGTMFNEADAFAMRKNIITQLPNTVSVTFDI